MAQLLVQPKARFVDDNGDPLASGKVYTYAAGTSTPLATYTDKDAGTPNANPVVLDARGEADIWLSNSSYKIVLKDSDDNLIYTVDDLKYINDGSIVAAMIASDAVTTAKIQDGAVTFAKLATGTLSYGDYVTVTEDYTILSTDDVVLINAIADPVTVTLPPASSNNNKKITIKRIDDTDIYDDTFTDGDVTVGTDQIALSSHPFTNTQRVQLTTSGTLPTGLSLATDYYVIYIDANNIKFASSKANAEVGTAVDITAASGGGTHTIATEVNSVTVEGYLSETIDGELSQTLSEKNDSIQSLSNGVSWYIISRSKAQSKYVISSSNSGAFSTTSVSEVSVTNLTATIQSSGTRLIRVSLADTANTSSQVKISRVSDNCLGNIYIYRSSPGVADAKVYGDSIRIKATGATDVELFPGKGIISLVQSLSKGKYTYSVKASVGTGSTLTLSYLYLVVEEI